MKNNIVGQKFGRLTVLNTTEKRVHRHIVYTCQCDCGNIIEVSSDSLKSGNVKSCGCLRKDRIIERNKKNAKHYFSNSRLYNTWSQMIQRCTNVNNESYKYYGKRGIKVCDEWICNFTNFYNWAINNGYSDDLTIDRIDTNGNYEPSNCRWTTVLVQNRNKRTTPKITYDGMEYGRAEFAKLIGMSASTFRNLLNQGLSVADIVTMSEEVKRGNCLKSYNNPFCKRIRCVETGQIFYSIRNAEREMHIDSSAISKVCRGKLNTAKGFHFEYVVEDDNKNA